MATTAEDFVKHHRCTVDEFRCMGSSPPYDSKIKLPLYARRGFPAVWLVDQQNRQLVQFSGPALASYGTRELLDANQPIALPGLANTETNLAGLC